MPKGIYQHKPWSEEHKRKLSESHKGKRSNNWKGDGAGKEAMHLWIIKQRGNPPKCIDCGKIGEKVDRHWNIEWSNVDHTYKRIEKDYVGRCKKCHRIYDIKVGLVGFDKGGHATKIIKEVAQEYRCQHTGIWAGEYCPQCKRIASNANWGESNKLVDQEVDTLQGGWGIEFAIMMNGLETMLNTQKEVETIKNFIKDLLLQEKARVIDSIWQQIQDKGITREVWQSEEKDYAMRNLVYLSDVAEIIKTLKPF